MKIIIIMFDEFGFTCHVLGCQLELKLLRDVT